MPTKRRAPELLAEDTRTPDSARALHARVLVRAKDFVDFCEVPELGDVTAQDVLFLDERPILRGSPRKVAQVAELLVHMVAAAEAQGQRAEPALLLEHLSLRAASRAQARCPVRAAGRLMHALCFDGLTVTVVQLDGAESPLAALPLNVATGSTLQVTLENPHDADLSAQLVLLFDLATPSRER